MASSNTMELNSILEEARSRKNAAQKKPAQSTAKSAPKATAQRTASAKKVRSFEDDFVLTDDEYVEIRPTAKKTPAKTASKQQAKPKKKTGLIVTLSIVGVVLLAAIGGLTFFLNSGKSAEGPNGILADNIYVNGTAIGGMTVDQARQTLAGVEKNLAAGIKVDIKADEKTFTYTGDKFSCTFNTDEILSQAKSYSEEKGLKTGKQEYNLK